MKIITFALATFFFNIQIIIAQCHINDWTALKALYESTNGDSWTNNTGWREVIGNVPTTNCNLEMLHGVKLDSQGRVESLTLVRNKLNGSIPVELGSLSHLTNLRMWSNQLNGSIPAELGNLNNLTYLLLDYNQLNDSIPAELGNLSSLKWLVLSVNQLIGSIPPELGNLSNLESLWLFNNQLSGNIPSELGNLSRLRDILFSNNQLSGSIPAELCNLFLGQFQIFNNNLEGCYPECLNSFCLGLVHYHGSSLISFGNNFNVPWEDFCTLGSGACTVCESPAVGTIECRE